MMRRLTAIVIGLVMVPTIAVAQGKTDETEKIRKDIKELEHRLQKVERKSALDRINFSGDFRFEAHSIKADIPSHFDGMRLQNLMVNTLFYYGATGQFPGSVADIGNFVKSHYADYLYFTNGLTFDQLKQAMGQFTPAMQQQLFGMLLPSTAVAALAGVPPKRR